MSNMSKSQALSLSRLLVSLHMESAGFVLIDLSSTANVDFAPTPRICLHYMLAGRAVLATDGATQTLSPGDFVCLPREGPHVLAGERGGARQHTKILRGLTPTDELAQLRFGAEGDLCGARLLSGSLTLSRLDRAAIDALMPQIVVLRPEQTKTASFLPPPMVIAACHGLGAGGFASALMQTLFFQAVRADVHRWLGEEPADFSNLQDYKIVTALRRIDREFHQPWTVAGLAKTVGMSRSAFAVHFQTLVGASPMARLTAVRMAEAHRLLQQGAPVGETALAVGYQSVTAFSRAFHRHHGEAPRAVRDA